MSLQSQYNITEKTMATYSPLDQLSGTYLNEVLKKAKVVVFDSGDILFEKNHDLDFYYYLLKGKLSIKKGILLSKTIKAKSDKALHPINTLIPSEAIVKAQADGHLLLIDPELLDRALAWSESNTQGDTEQSANQSTSTSTDQAFDEAYFDWMTSLLEFPLFLNLPPANITELFEQFERIEVESGQAIIKEGDDGDYFYLLISGSAQVAVGDNNTILATLKPGAYFGEDALVSSTVRSATVTMNEAGSLARLDKESFQNLLHNPLVQYITQQGYQEKLNDAEHSAALLDIRSNSEFEHIPFPDCQHIPLSELRASLALLDKTLTYYLTEEGGQRSDIAAHILSQNQFDVFVLRS